MAKVRAKPLDSEQLRAEVREAYLRSRKAPG
jgi:hypothetical protein